MTYQRFVLPLARLDILAAVASYEDQRAGLGAQMARQVELALDRAAANPWMFAPVEGTIRRVLCRRFPYAVFFEVEDERIFVLAVTHVRRDPIAWQSRATPDEP